MQSWMITWMISSVRCCVGSEANKIQIGGGHYKVKGIEPWDYIVANNLGYLEGNVVKYVSRYKEKNGIEDLKKAQHYLQKLIEVNSGN